MMIETPLVRILKRIKSLLDAADLAGLSGTPGITVRHYRGRHANPEERPSIGLRMVADEVNTESYVTNDERLCYLSLDLIVDCDMASEDSDIDPTGLERLGRIANAAVAVLKDETAVDGEGNILRALCDAVVDEGVEADDNFEADEARFIHRLVVLYRTAINDPNLLLAHEESI